MIKPKSPREVEKMRAAGRIVANVLKRMREMTVPGAALKELDAEAEEIIREQGGRPLFKGYRGFPATICASINEEVVHGIPGERVLREGEILSVDVGVSLAGYCADAARTMPVGAVAEDALSLIEICREALEKAIAAAKCGGRLSDIARTVQTYAESHGRSVVRTYTGHGIGRVMHEEPQIPNFVAPMFKMSDPVLRKGMTLAIEPMVNAGGYRVKTLQDGWTVVTEDGSLSAHFEDTVAVADGGGDVLTR